MQAAASAFHEDIEAFRLMRTKLDWPDVFVEAERLSLKYTGSLLVRSIDVLHLASSIVIGVKVFITADTRQYALAKKAGLNAEIIR